MSRIRINAYGVSESVNLLTAEIRNILAEIGGDLAASRTVLRLNRNLQNSRFYGREGDLIVNWGSAREIPERVIGDAILLNNPRAVNTASDKLKAFAALTAGGVKTVPSTSDREEAQAWVDAGHHVFCRRELRGHSGSGIVVVANHPIEDAGNVEIVDTLPSVPLYTRGVSAQHREYRIHVFKGVILFIQQKRRASGYRDNPNYSNVVRNHGNGWVYGHNQITQPNAEVLSEAVKAVEAIGLDFGAVDVLSRQDEAWVLEVNTAPGLTGDTNRANYANAIIAVSNGQPIQGIEQPEERSLDDIFPDWQEQAAEELTGATADGRELLEEETPRFSEGNRIRLSEAGRNEFEHSYWNPHDEMGYVIEVHRGLTVAWDNGEYNTYEAEHLELVPLEEDRPTIRTLNEVSRTSDGSSTESPLSIGDRVTLSDAGREVVQHSRQNPYDFAGTVSGTDLYPMEYSVIWDNGEYNIYNRGHLTVINEGDTMVPDYSVRWDGGVTNTHMDSELSPIGERSEGRVLSTVRADDSSQLSVRTRVRLSMQGRQTFPDTSYNPHNEIGSITRVLDESGYPYEVVWDTGISNLYREEDLIIHIDSDTPTEGNDDVLTVSATARPPRRFSEGDRVRLSLLGRIAFSDSQDHPHNLSGSIMATNGNTLQETINEFVLWDNGISTFYNPAHLESSEDTTATEEAELFQWDLLPVGSRVQFTESGRESYENSRSNPHYGAGTITDIIREVTETSSEELICFPYMVDWDNGSRNTYRVGDIELMRDVQEPAFEVGNHVRLSADGRASFRNTSINPHDGCGIVSGISEGLVMPVHVSWGPDVENTYRPCHLELIDAPSIEENQNVEDGRLPVGTSVQLSDVAMRRYNNTPSNPHGVTGTIRSNTSGIAGSLFCYSVAWPNETRNTYREDDLVVFGEQSLPQPPLELSRGARVRLSEQGRQTYPATDPSNPHELLGRLVDFNPDRGFPYSVNWDNGSSNIYREGELLAVEDQPSQDTQSSVTTTEELPEIVVGATVTRSQQWMETALQHHLPLVNSLGVVEEIMRGGIYRVRWDNGNNVCSYPRRALELPQEVPNPTSVGDIVRLKLSDRESIPNNEGCLRGIVVSVAGDYVFGVRWDHNEHQDLYLGTSLELIQANPHDGYRAISEIVEDQPSQDTQSPATTTSANIGEIVVGTTVRMLRTHIRPAAPVGSIGVVRSIVGGGLYIVDWEGQDNNHVGSLRGELEIVSRPETQTTFEIGARVRLAGGASHETALGVLPEGVAGVILGINESGFVDVNWDYNNFFTTHRIDDLVLAPTASMPVSIFAGSRVRLAPEVQEFYALDISAGATGVVNNIYESGFFEVCWNNDDGTYVACHELHELELAEEEASTLVDIFEEEQEAEFIPYTDEMYYILETDAGRFVGEYSAECRGFWDTQGEMRYEDDVTVITEVNLHA